MFTSAPRGALTLELRSGRAIRIESRANATSIRRGVL